MPNISIYDYVTASNIKSYVDSFEKDRTPYLGETLFPAEQQMGLSLEFLKVSMGIPVVLKPSAFDANAVIRPRIGVEINKANMPFFKESKLVNEEDRQELNKIIGTGNRAMIDAIVKRIFDDEKDLVDGARARCEQMRMQLLTTGAISITSNGQNYDYDYGIPDNHKPTVTKSWSDPTADIIGNIKEWQEMIEDEKGEKPTRALCNSKTWAYFLANNNIRNGVLGNSSAAPISEGQARNYLAATLDLDIAVYSKRYSDENGVSHKYVGDDIFAIFPDGELGKTMRGTTPEESDLMNNNAANVAIVDNGIAITTMTKVDPVNVETKVTMITLPTFPTADRLVIADVTV